MLDCMYSEVDYGSMSFVLCCMRRQKIAKLQTLVALVICTTLTNVTMCGAGPTVHHRRVRGGSVVVASVSI